MNERVRKQPSVYWHQIKELWKGCQIVDGPVAVENKPGVMLGVTALSKIQIENDVAIVGKVRSSESNVSHWNRQFTSTRTVTSGIAKCSTNGNSTRIICGSYRHKLTKDTQVRCRDSRKSLEHRQAFCRWSRDVSWRSCLA